MILDDFFDVGQAEAEAFDVVTVAGRDAVELLKYTLLVLFGDSYAIVFDGTDSPLESVVLFSKDPPAAYAHEILHLFGAHDLYRGAEYQRPVTDYIKKEYPLEIMYTITDEEGNIKPTYVESEITVTAYQLGWLEETEELLKFPELKRSIFY